MWRFWPPQGYNYHYSTKKHPIYKDQILSSNIYIPFSSMISTTSCPRSTLIIFLYSRPTELVPSSEWIRSYRLSNQLRFEPNERCALPLLTSGGLQWRWRQSCFNEALKLCNLVIGDYNTDFVKPLIFFKCLHFKVAQRVLIKNLKPLS
jgi:hypothetical protein